MSYKINTFIKSDKVVASYEKRLSICIQTNGFSFSISSSDNELLTFGDVDCDMSVQMSSLIHDIKAAFAEMEIIPYGFHGSELVVASRQFVWIPQHLYDESKKRSYVEALCRIEPGMGVFSDYSDTVNATLVFTANSGIVSAFQIAAPGLNVRCQHSKMVNAGIVASSNMKSVLMINVRDGQSDFAVFCNKKLQISNTYECVNFDETIYHALNLTKQFHLDDVPLTAVICGDVDRESFGRIGSFFPEVILYTGGKMTLPVAEMQHLPLYRYALMF
ncbi:MAG: DUF3822 family protein [Bacteroidales bacterium]|nr:DUF3822 family protein [Bacteroidales bacterium]